MADPASSAWIVRSLGLHESAGDGDEAIDVALVGHAGSSHDLDDSPEGLLRDRVGSRARLEVRNPSLEEELATRRILQREVDEGMEELLQGPCWVGRELHALEPFEEPAIPVCEHRVVERVFRVEVLVERGLADADLPCQPVQRDPQQTQLGGELPRGRHDLFSALQSALRHLARHEPLPIIDRSIAYQ